MFCSLAPTHLKFSLSYFLLFTKKFAQFTPIFKNKVLIFHSIACSLPLASTVKIQKVQSSVSTRIPTPTSVSHSCSRQPPDDILTVKSSCLLSVLNFLALFMWPGPVAGSTDLRLEPSFLDSTFWLPSFQSALLPHPHPRSPGRVHNIDRVCDQ